VSRRVADYSSEVAKRMIPRLSRQTLNDMAALKMDQAMLERFLERLDDALFSWLGVDENGEPFAAFGICFNDLQHAFSFMVCTEECFARHGRWVTVQIARLLHSDRLDPFPGIEVELITANDETAAKWFETIGFCKDNDYTNEHTARYIFRR
jgi:hypothetical protein